MRKVASFGNEEMQTEQINVLSKIFANCKNFAESKAMIEVLFTDSEKTTIAQRLAILRMIRKDFNYAEIEKDLKTSPNTITKTRINYDKAPKKLKDLFAEILEKYRFRKSDFETNDEPIDYGKFIETSSGGIRKYLKEKPKEK